MFVLHYNNIYLGFLSFQQIITTLRENSLLSSFFLFAKNIEEEIQSFENYLNIAKD